MKKALLLTLVLSSALVLSGCTQDVTDKELTVQMNGQDVQGAYTGTLTDNKASGTATFTVKVDDNNRWVYEGDFADNSFSGKGTITDYPLTLTYDNSEIKGVYSGDVVDGVLTGNGIFTDSEDELDFSYTGEFDNGTLSGKGELSYNKLIVHFSDADREGSYEGETIDGIPAGEGSFSAETDEGEKYTYTGQWKDGVFDGQGQRLFDSDEYYDRIGTFTKGDFTPTKADRIISLGTFPKMSFSVPEEAKEFIEKHSDFFTASKASSLDKYVDSKVGYKQLMKTPAKYGNKLIKVTGYHVNQIWEYDDFWGETQTEMLITDSDYDNYYYVYYLGKAKGIYEDSEITLYALPINSSSYETTIGGTNNCYILYGCNVSKE